MAAGKQTVSAAQFKDRCLAVIDEVSTSGVEVIVTKRGKPMVRIVPIVDPARDSSLAGAIIHQDEDIFSTGESWAADR